MEWYYVQLEKQVGPVSESELNRLYDSKVIDASTLVWNEQMPDWLTYAIATGQAVEAVSLNTPPALNSNQSSVWKRGKGLVFARGADLPCRCVKCNQPAEGLPITKKLSYYHPWVYILILINLLIMLIVAACISKKATVDVPVCDFHRGRLKKGVLLSWLFCLGSIGLFVVAFAQSSGGLAWAGIISLVMGIAFGLTMGRLVYTSKIDADYVWIKGVCSEYLEELPEAPSQV